MELFFVGSKHFQTKLLCEANHAFNKTFVVIGIWSNVERVWPEMLRVDALQLVFTCHCEPSQLLVPNHFVECDP